MPDENLQVEESTVPQVENMDASVPDIDLFADSDEEVQRIATELGGPQEPVETPPEEIVPEAAEEPEVPPEEPPATPEPVQRAMEDIQRRDVELRQREQALKAQYGAAQELADLKARFKDDPMSAIQQMGGDPSSVINSILPDPQVEEMANNPVVKKLQDKIDALHKKQEEHQKKLQSEAAQATRIQTYNEYKGFAESAKQEEYPLLSAFSDGLAPEQMFQAATHYAAQHQRMPESTELAKYTETLLLGQAKELIERVRSIPAFAEYFKDGQSQQETAQTSNAPTGKSITLQNRNTAEPPAQPKKITNWSESSNADVIQAGLNATGGSLFDPVK